MREQQNTHDPRRQQQEQTALTREQIALKCMEFLAEHDGSEELYQMLHGELGLSHEEMEAMGFDLTHRYEHEPSPGINGPKL